jgi:hypothetical protein
VDLKSRSEASSPPGPAESLRNPRRAAIVLMLVVWLAYAFPVLGGKVRFPLGFEPSVRLRGESVHPDMYDVYHNILPWRVHQSERWRDGDIPGWDPHRFAGMSLVADIGMANWYPPTWLYATGSFLWIFTVSGLLSLLGAMLLAYWFLRLLDLHPYASALGAIGFTFSAFMIKFHEHEGVFQAAMWLPLALGGMELIHRGRRRSGVVLATAGLALSLLAGHAQIALYVWLAAGAWGGAALLTRLLPGRGARASGRELGAETALMAAPFVLALAVSAVQVLPSAEIAPYLARQRYTFESVKVTAIPPSQLPTMLIPDYRGNPLDHNWVGHLNYLEQTMYPGVVFLPLALAGAFHHRRREAVVLACMVAVGLLAATGTPLYRAILALPGFGRTLWMDRFLFFVNTGLAFLAALGLDALLRAPGRRGRTLAVGAALVLSAAAAALAVAGSPGVARGYLLTRGLRSAAFLAATAVLLALLRPTRRMLAVPLVLLAAADLWLFGFPIHLWHKPAPAMAVTPLVRRLQDLPGPRPRYASLGKRHEPVLAPNAALRHGLYGLEGYDITVPRNVAELLTVAQADQLVWSNTNWLGPFDAATFRSPVMDLLGVVAVVQPRDVPSAPSTTEEGAFDDGQTAVLRRPGAFPPAFLVPCWRVLPPDAVLPTLRTMSSDELRTTALVDRSVGGAALPPSPAACTPGGSAAVETYEPERVVASTRSEAPSLLVLSDTWLPGWAVTVDGEPEDLLEVDHALRGVPVPAGAHRVEFGYRPASLRAGAAISLTTLAGLAVVPFAGRRRRSRAAPGRGPDRPGQGRRRSRMLRA